MRWRSHLVRCSCCRVVDVHSTELCGFFSLLLYDFFSPLPLNSSLAAIVDLLDNVATRVVLTQPLHHCKKVLPILCNDLRDLRLNDIQTGLSSRRLTLLGMGLQKNIIKMNTKWLCKTCLSYPTSTPQHWQFYVMISVTFESEGHANWPLPSAGWRCRGWVYKKQYQINTKWLKTHFMIKWVST